MSAKRLTRPMVERTVHMVDNSGLLDILAPPTPAGQRGRKGRIRANTRLWAIGVILFRALTGRFPFDDEAYPMLIVKICSDTPPRPSAYRSDLPPDLDALILRCLDKDPDRRYQTTLAFAEDLCRVRERRPISVKPIGAAGRLRRWVERRPAVAAALGSALLILVTGLVVALNLLGWARESEAAALAAARSARTEAARAGYTAAVHALAGYDARAGQHQIEAASGHDAAFADAVEGKFDRHGASGGGGGIGQKHLFRGDEAGFDMHFDCSSSGMNLSGKNRPARWRRRSRIAWARRPRRPFC